jgi:hypothetical protein
METGRLPVAMGWMRQAARFWDKARARPAGDLLRAAMRESWEAAVAAELGDGRADCWAAHLQTCFRQENHILAWDDGPTPVAAVLEAATARWLEAATSLPPLPVAVPAHDAVRSVPASWSLGFKMLTYLRWVAARRTIPGAHERHELFWFDLNNEKQIRAVATFRMGLHELQIERGRHGRRQPRDERRCRFCGEREDEAHMIFYCPVYEEARGEAQALFAGVPGPEVGMDIRMQIFLNPRPGMFPGFWGMMAKFLVTCFDVRATSLIATGEGEEGES